MSEKRKGWIEDRKTYSFVLPEALGDQLTTLAIKNNCSKSKVVRDILGDYIKASAMLERIR